MARFSYVDLGGLDLVVLDVVDELEKPECCECLVQKGDDLLLRKVHLALVDDRLEVSHWFLVDEVQLEIQILESPVVESLAAENVRIPEEKFFELVDQIKLIALDRGFFPLDLVGYHADKNLLEVFPHYRWDYMAVETLADDFGVILEFNLSLELFVVTPPQLALQDLIVELSIHTGWLRQLM